MGATAGKDKCFTVVSQGIATSATSFQLEYSPRARYRYALMRHIDSSLEKEALRHNTDAADAGVLGFFVYLIPQ